MGFSRSEGEVLMSIQDWAMRRKLHCDAMLSCDPTDTSPSSAWTTSNVQLSITHCPQKTPPHHPPKSSFLQPPQPHPACHKSPWASCYATSHRSKANSASKLPWYAPPLVGPDATPPQLSYRRHTGSPAPATQPAISLRRFFYQILAPQHIYCGIPFLLFAASKYVNPSFSILPSHPKHLFGSI